MEIHQSHDHGALQSWQKADSKPHPEQNAAILTIIALQF